jgi:hypothetical protein
MRALTGFALALAGVLSNAPVPAQTVYKWVDRDGTVNFSSAPPPGTRQHEVGTVEIDPGPTPEAQQEADERVRALGDAADRMRDERVSGQEDKEATVSEAEAGLRRAQADLARAQIQNPEDWQTIAGGGGRFLKDNYFERIRAAQDAVKRSEENLARARRDAR